MELLFPLLLLVPLLLLIMSQRRKQKAFADQQGRIRPGMEIMTTAGMFATVVEVDGDVMVLEVADDVYLRWSRLAVGRIVDESGATDLDDDELEDDEVMDDDAAEPAATDARDRSAVTTQSSETVDIRKSDSARDGA